MNIFLKSFLLLGSIVVWSGCSREDFVNNNVDKGEENFISLTVNTPVADKVVFPKSRAGEHIQEVQEWTIKTLNLYMFEKKSTGTGDAAYVLYSKNEGITFSGGEQTPGSLVGTDTGSGTYTFSTKVTDDMIGKTFKFVLLANNKAVIANTVGSTTLAEFKTNTSTYVLNSENESSDIVVGKPNVMGASTGFAMADIAEDATTNSEDVTVGYSDVNIKANLLRNVARIDIFNYTPNMTITGAKLLNAASTSYLMGKGGGLASEFNPYTGKLIKYLSSAPTLDWVNQFTNGGVAYVPAPEEGDSEVASRTRNTLKHVFYLHEKENTADDNCTAVQIDYKLKSNVGGITLNKSMVVKFKKSDAGYINPVRNFLYTIKLGDGSIVDDCIKVASVIVNDWISGGDITEEINPDEDLVIVPQP